MTDAAPRVRFCPAPSGWLHVGSARAALYNWLHARRHGGVFVLRIEDTDASRATDESMRSMMEALAWLGLEWDEGPEESGDSRGSYGPYRQSERTALYAEVADRLERIGATYRDYRTPDELEAWRERHRSGEGDGPPVVKASTFEHDDATLARFADEGRAYSVRLRTPEAGQFVLDDLVRGEVTWDWAQVADPVIRRSDGSATYPLANSVDDVAHGISLVCRGEDLLSVTPRQTVLHELLVTDGLIDEALAAVGLPARGASWGPPATFAHLPIVVGPDRKKLSKRHGSVSVQELRRQGFLPETLRNYLALLGWSTRDGRERLTDDELRESFDLASVGRSSAAFDPDKLTAFNGERIRDLEPDDLADRLLPWLDGTEGGDVLVSRPPSEDERTIVRRLVPLVQERMERLDEIQRYAPPFFVTELEIDPDAVNSVLKDSRAIGALDAALRVLADIDWTVTAIEEALRGLVDELGTGFGKIAQPIRVAVTGSKVSPPLFESLDVLGRDVVLERLERGVAVARNAVG